jgi:hypothetical protein
VIVNTAIGRVQGGDVLEWGGVLPPPHATWTVNSADVAAGIAVAAAVGHALGPGIGIIVHVRGRGAGHGWRHCEVGLGRHSGCFVGGVVARGPAEVVGVVADLVGDDGDGVGAIVSTKALHLGEGRVRGQARRLPREHRGFPLLALGLFLGKSLLFLAHLAA